MIRTVMKQVGEEAFVSVGVNVDNPIAFDPAFAYSESFITRSVQREPGDTDLDDQRDIRRIDAHRIAIHHAAVHHDEVRVAHRRREPRLDRDLDFLQDHERFW